ncbi:uncharacterized protein LY89DRAFT_664149 [Mollisia scopiformis]|uniref:Uncharacterized protein n=1 Tax=Mollisia scopiformis TaxID=149040 RepID=A0A194XQ43_MOLSC|nr:uncharacterized protein LY89DRAFT_664149 [Mollisia scopiformis]KUJ22313.1 hypothetical protein LY89DRAFT_664149 [Mollisia scopiformis]
MDQTNGSIERLRHKVKHGRGHTKGSKNKSILPNSSTSRTSKRGGREKKRKSHFLGTQKIKNDVLQRRRRTITASATQKKSIGETRKLKHNKKEVFHEDHSWKLTQFTVFTKLPREIQIMIFGLALDAAPTLIEAAYNFSTYRFELSTSTADILSVCGLGCLPKNFKPVYLPSLTPDRSRWMPHPSGLYPKPKRPYNRLEPLYIRPEQDTLYLILKNLDIRRYLSHPENQVLRHLLKLKTLTVFEGALHGAEVTVDRRKKWDIETEELPEGQAESTQDAGRRGS